MSPFPKGESETRTELIDRQLALAGWSSSRRTLVEEFLIRPAEPEADSARAQFADYVLLGPDKKPLAIVEAKRSSRDELAGKRQAADYAEAIKRQDWSSPVYFSYQRQ